MPELDVITTTRPLRPSLEVARSSPSKSRLLFALMTLATSATVFGLYGFHGRFFRDDGNLFYTGQQMAKGVPPYVSLFDHNSPLSYMLCGAGSMLSNVLDSPELITTRVLFYALTCLGVVALFYLAATLFNSNRDAFLTILFFLSFSGFSRHVASGPRKQMPMFLLQALSLLLTSRRQWFWAGLTGSLSFLSWQPTLIFTLATFVIAVLQPGSRRWRATAMTLLGFLIPLGLVIAYFQAHGALYELIDGSILFNLTYLDRGDVSLLERLTLPLTSFFSGFGTSLVFILVGGLMMVYAYTWRRRRHTSVLAVVRDDPWSPVLLTFPAPVLWSFLDWQQYPDAYILLPYFALGCALLAGKLLDLISQRTPSLLNGTPKPSGTFLLSCGLIGLCLGNVYYERETGLSTQMEQAREIVRRFGRDVKIVSLGAPNLMAMMRRTNPNRYLFLDSGIDRKINAETPGGFKEWLAQLEKQSPDIIAFDRVLPSGPERKNLTTWLFKNFRRMDDLDPWILFVRHGLKPDPKAAKEDRDPPQKEFTEPSDEEYFKQKREAEG